MEKNNRKKTIPQKQKRRESRFEQLPLFYKQIQICPKKTGNAFLKMTKE